MRCTVIKLEMDQPFKTKRNFYNQKSSDFVGCLSKLNKYWKRTRYYSLGVSNFSNEIKCLQTDSRQTVQWAGSSARMSQTRTAEHIGNVELKPTVSKIRTTT